MCIAQNDMRIHMRTGIPYAPMDLFGLPKWICSGALEPSEHAGSDCFGTYAAIGTCVAILIDIEQSTLDACGAHK